MINLNALESLPRAFAIPSDLPIMKWMKDIGQVGRITFVRTGILCLLLSGTMACSLLSFSVSTPTPAATLSPSQIPSATPVPPTATPTTESPTPTNEVVEQPVQTDTPAVLSVPQPAAASRFKPGDPVKLDRIEMKSRAEGWGISGGIVLTTKDGGLTWHEATPPEVFPPGSDVTAYGAFLNARTAWIIFGADGQINPAASVWFTTDGGKFWTPGPALNHQAYGDTVWAEFYVLDSQNLWLMIRGVYVGAGTHRDHQLFRSVDGGLSWALLDSQTSDDYTGLIFTDVNNGLRTLQTTGAYMGGPPVYEVTGDGGATWEPRELPNPPGAPDLFNQYPYCETYQPVVPSGNQIRLLVGCFEFGDPPKKFSGFFYSSQDGGKSWLTTPLPKNVRAEDGRMLYFGANYVLLLGRETYLSTSDGSAWSFVKSVNWDGSFSFTDPQYGWAVAVLNNETALVRTENGAVTWKIIKSVMAN